MSQYYNLVSYQASGQPYDNSYKPGQQLQGYWGEFTDQAGNQFSATFNKVAGNAPALGQVYGDIIAATSQKGNQYYKFKSAQRPQGQPGQPVQYATNAQQLNSQPPVQQPQNAPQQPVNVSEQIPGWFVPYGNMINYIYRETKKMAEMDMPTGVDNGSFAVDTPPAAPVKAEPEAEAPAPIEGEPVPDVPAGMFDVPEGEPEPNEEG